MTHGFSRHLVAWTIWLAVAVPQADALPIGFHVNQGKIPYNEIKTPHFILYHDARAPAEAKAIAQDLDQARPILEEWFAVRRGRILPVVMSAVTDNASFANFITDAVELQTLGQGGRDLAWHEYTHSTMYRHLDNWLGPAGSTIHLPFMPAWWIEGLAEATSRSVSSDLAAAVERGFALHGHWPSYERLHSLYSKNAFALEGYATSGNFVSFILRKYGASKLPTLLNDFFHYSMPWWWPWAAVPFNGFLPMDAALENMTGKNGEALYAEYRAAAEAYWKTQGPSLIGPNSGESFSNSSAIQVRDGRVYTAFNDGGTLKEAVLGFDQSSGRWVDHWSDSQTLPRKLASFARIMRPDLKAFVFERQDDDATHQLVTISQGAGVVRHAEPQGYIGNIFVSQDKIIWLTRHNDRSSLCFAPLNLIKASKPILRKNVSCGATATFPKSLEFLGETQQRDATGKLITTEIFLAEHQEALSGDRTQILKFSPNSGKVISMASPEDGRTMAFTRRGNDLWALVATLNGRLLRRLNEEGQCLDESPLSDYPDRIFAFGEHDLLLPLYSNGRWRLLRKRPSEFLKRSCTPTKGPSSPLMYAMAHPGASFQTALQATSPWQTAQESEAPQPTAPKGPEPTQNYESKPSNWRGRPVFAAPWLAADALGYQVGMLSVPLMDGMQNETVRLSMMYGTAGSRFPSTELSLLSTRFEATYQLDTFRDQSFNGVYFDPASNLSKVLYYDERGMRVTRTSYFGGPDINLAAGVKSSTLKPYIGPSKVRQGHHNELFLALSNSTQLGSSKITLATSVDGRAVPQGINNNFEYNALAFGATLARNIMIRGWRTSNLSLGLTAARTRGPKPKHLREVYRPLKTFVPGSGGGLNEINVSISGPGALTSAQYGDTQARTKAAWTVPLVEDLETLIGIFYLERLDFTAFFNYGGAWYGPKPDNDRLIAAHGYNLDLSTDIKGITVGIGGGIGQVIGHAFESYFTFSFDALIN